MQGSACAKMLWAPGKLRTPAEIRRPTTPIGQLTSTFSLHSTCIWGASSFFPTTEIACLRWSGDVRWKFFGHLRTVFLLCYSLQMLSRSTSTIISDHQHPSTISVGISSFALWDHYAPKNRSKDVKISGANLRNAQTVAVNPENRV